MPFRSPNRSGVEYLGFGLDWGILNQYRDPVVPTLLIGAEARLAVSEPMLSCGGLRGCADPSDIDGSGPSREAGVSRAVTEVF